MNRRLACLALLAGVFVAPGELVAQPAVTMGCDPSASLEGAVRYRNLSNQAVGATEILIGESPLTTTTQGHITWGGGKAIAFTYDGTSLTTTIPTSTPSPVARTVGDLGTLNYLEIRITKNTSTSAISLTDVYLGSQALGSVGKAAGTTGATCWSVTGVDLTGAFTLTGTLALTGGFGGSDSSHVQVNVGFVIPTDTEGPLTSNVSVTPHPVLLNGDATVKALVSDVDRGDAFIASADYSLNGGAWLPMTAKDGAFDEVEEYVEVTFDAFVLGSNSVCVRGTDALGNVGDATCQSFLVTYKFDGFFSPVENDFVNVAKGGQAVPVKWRLTDANGVPIDDAASFVGLFSSENLCAGGSPTDAVDEEAAGGSGLQYDGDGYWQFNWKTSKDYANTCRAMYVEFNSGATSPVVKFQFKK